MEVYIRRNLLHAGLKEEYARLFSTKLALEQVIEYCVQHNQIIRSDSNEGDPTYSLNSELQVISSREEMMQGLLFTAHIYPREETLHIS
jgi:hypothetical protein